MAAHLQPRLVLRFGVTGHRPPRLSVADHDAVRADCLDLFARAQVQLAAIHARHPTAFGAELPLAKLVSSLAEGADVIAAEAALDCGMGLSACLPLPASVYAGDFTSESWALSARLIEQAESVLEFAEIPGGHEHAYEAAGRLVMAQSDILIAVWDGDPAQGRAGTAQIVAEAIAMHLPVIHIHPQRPGDMQLIWPSFEDEDAEAAADEATPTDFDARLRAVIAAVTEPPQGEGLSSLEAYLRSQPAVEQRAFAWPLLLAVTGARRWGATRFRIGGVAQSRAWLTGKTKPLAGLGPFGEVLDGRLLDRYAHADAEATRFAMRYRSTFVTNFALAGLAVLLALSGLLFPVLKLALIALELLVIGLIMLNTQAGRRLNLHQCWLDRRHVAERMRLLVLTAPLGRPGLRSGEDGHQPPNWAYWYVRANARELGMPSARIDAAYLETARADLIELVDEQTRYHHTNARAMTHADHNLHHTGDMLFFGTVLACLAFIVVYVVSHGARIAVLGMGAAELVTFVTALFPALAAALYGIRMQGDFAASGRRSREIESQLRRIRARIERDPLTYHGLVERARGVREVLLAEVQQWRSHYESRPLTLPG